MCLPGAGVDVSGGSFRDGLTRFRFRQAEGVMANEYGQYLNEERTSELLIKRRKNRVNIRIAPEHISKDRAHSAYE
jgi:hypothetical protein